jgi:hypothetical protein
VSDEKEETGLTASCYKGRVPEMQRGTRSNPVQKRRGAFKKFSENHRTTNAGKVSERV